MRTYFTRTTKEVGVATLFTQLNLRVPKFMMRVNTHVEVDIAKWNRCGGVLSAYARNIEGRKVEYLIQEVDRAIDDVIARNYFTKEDIDEAVCAVVYREAREAQILDEEQQMRDAQRRQEAERIARAREDADVRAYLHSLIEGMKDGSIRIEGRGRNKGGRYTPNTIKMWNSLALIVEKYYKLHPFSWDDIDKRFATRFRAWMEDEGYMAKTINKYIGQFVALLNRAYDEGKHTNSSAAGWFLKPMVKESEKAAEIYLTADELNALYQMPLEGERALVRDIFLVGCCTCQRVSDYSRLRKENFVTTARGVKVVKIEQMKTKNVVTIPVLDDKLTKIMERYQYSLPQLPATFDVILNRYMKEICKELSESVPSLREEYPTILTMKEREKEAKGEITFKRDADGRVVKPKYALVTSHTARRTGITNLYLTGKFDVYQMMHVSGHKEAKTFREYIKLSGDEMAEQIADKMGNDNLF